MNNTASSEVEWATITPDKVIVANTKKVWICSPFANDDQFAEPMTGTSNAETTRMLLEGAMAAAKIAIPVSCNPPILTQKQLVWQFIGTYHLAKATPLLMKEAGKRFAIALRHDLSNWAFEKAQKTKGHDQLALLDIKSLGYQAKELVESIIPSVSTTLLDYFYRSVNDIDPIDCVGYIHATERLSLSETQNHIHKVDNLLPENVNATRSLRVHNTQGGDAEKVEKNADLIARLSPSERTRAIRACYETSVLLYSLPREGYLLETELENMFQPFKLEAR